jgi:hypothetical protein
LQTKWSVYRLQVVMQLEDATSRGAYATCPGRTLQPQLPCWRWRSLLDAATGAWADAATAARPRRIPRVTLIRVSFT